MKGRLTEIQHLLFPGKPADWPTVRHTAGTSGWRISAPCLSMLLKWENTDLPTPAPALRSFRAVSHLAHETRLGDSTARGFSPMRSVSMLARNDHDALVHAAATDFFAVSDFFASLVGDAFLVAFLTSAHRAF